MQMQGMQEATTGEGSRLPDVLVTADISGVEDMAPEWAKMKKRQDENQRRIQDREASRLQRQLHRERQKRETQSSQSQYEQQHSQQ
jgi:hypothetical protein